jgi:large subunit ribosomal protein L46
MRRFIATAAQPTTRIAAGIILKRNPVMLRTPTNFEVAHAQFRNRDQGVPYNASFYESDKTMPRRSSDAEAELPFISRVTDADAKRDEKSMERALDRSLYLVVKKNRSEHAWQFPQGGLEPNEALHEVRHW